MTLKTRTSAAGLVGLLILGLAGCQEDNSSTAAQQNAAAKAPDAPAAPQPKSLDELAKQKQQGGANPYAKGSGYPGAR